MKVECPRAQRMGCIPGEGAIPYPRGCTVVCIQAIAAIVLEAASGKGDDATRVDAIATITPECALYYLHRAGAGGVERIVLVIVAIVSQHRVADHHPAVLHIQPIVKIAAAVLAHHLAALDAHLSIGHTPHRDVAAVVAVRQAAVATITPVSHRHVTQVTCAPVEHQSCPLVGCAVRRRGERDRLDRCAHRLQMAQNL